VGRKPPNCPVALGISDFVTLPEEDQATAIDNMHKKIGKDRTCCLDKFWLDQPVMFDWKADLTGTGSRSLKCDIRVD